MKEKVHFQKCISRDVDFFGSFVKLQEQVLISTCHECAIKDLITRTQRGSVLKRMPLQPYVELQTTTKFGKKMWLPIKHYVFYGLGFALMWVVRMSSCKHVYLD